MPQLLQHIDAIAREKERDVLFVHFETYDRDDQDSAREQLITWLDQNHIPYAPCMGLEEENVIGSYMGDLYIDVPFDIANPQFQKLSEHLEEENGDMKIDGVLFFTLSLEVAQEIEADRKSFFEEDFDDEEFDENDLIVIDEIDAQKDKDSENDDWNGVRS